jgi:hypothetical protein
VGEDSAKGAEEERKKRKERKEAMQYRKKNASKE